LIKNIAAQTHDGSGGTTAAPVAGGSNEVGSRSYLIALKDITTADLTDY